jgi:tRNA pseudouridine38-40 synthase
VVVERNIKLTIEYDGRGFAGWQVQPRQRTVQGELEKAIHRLTSKKIRLYVAGRTDAGVHAIGQVANFKIGHSLPLEKYRDGLNFYLPEKIRIRRVEEAPFGFHARYDAVYRQYRYYIGFEKTALVSQKRWEIEPALDIQLLNRAAEYILGDYDFTACCVVSSQKENNRCVVFRSRWRQTGSTLVYEIVADRFVHSMIRSLVGLMVDLARGAMTFETFREILNSGDHTAIKHVAPARGLYLVAIGY